MTGGQMAPTTLPGMRTTTTPYGRDVRVAGYPIHIAEMLATLKGVAYLSRVALCGVAHITKAKRAIRKAFQAQLDGKGFSLVEILSTCPVTWGLQPIDAVRWLETNMVPAFPLGEFVADGQKEHA
jgi:2-oxoglutarate ferredoxin oxidoreductase subunit beta